MAGAALKMTAARSPVASQDVDMLPHAPGHGAAVTHSQHPVSGPRQACVQHPPASSQVRQLPTHKRVPDSKTHAVKAAHRKLAA